MLSEHRQHLGRTTHGPGHAVALPLLLLLAVGAAGCVEGELAPYPPPTPAAEQQAEGTTPPTDDDPQPPPPVAPPTSQPKPQRIVDKTFDDLKFDIEPDEPFEKEMLSEEVESLFGKRIRIRGYIRPTFQREGITQFIFVRDNLECCFGPGAALYDCIIIDMVPGETASFTTRPVAVEGTFELDEFVGPDGKHLAIFHMDAEKVQ